MSNVKTSGDLNTFAAEAGNLYQHAVGLNREDFQLRALKYPLLRLSIHGVSAEDQKELADLAKDVVEERDVTRASDKITNRKSASPIAVAIADIVRSAQGSKWVTMLGSIVGAHAALSLTAGGRNDVGFDIVGAIVGATCLNSDKFLQEVIGNDIKAFVERDL
jgi:hypothetical protein